MEKDLTKLFDLLKQVKDAKNKVESLIEPFKNNTDAGNIQSYVNTCHENLDKIQRIILEQMKFAEIMG